MINKKEKQKFLKPGGRNLVILSLVAVVFSLTTTAISLAIYRATGDIYLDRSRPGYISEEEGDGEKQNISDDFTSEGKIDEEVMKKYLEEVEALEKSIEDMSDSFSAKAISDSTLGIE